KADMIGGTVKDFLKKNSISPATVYLGVPREAVILRYVKLPLAVKENLKDSLRYELEKYVPFSEDEIYFDYQTIAEDKEGGQLTLLLIAAKRESVDPYISSMGKVGIGISGIEIGSTAMVNYFWSQKDAIGADRCAIVYMRDGCLELNLMRGGFLDYSRSINQEKWEADLPGAISHELLKLKAGLEKEEDRLCTVFCGFDTRPELLNHLKADEDIEIHPVDLSRAGIPSANIIPAYGLAMKGIQRLPADINLLPGTLRKRPNKAGYYTMLVLAGLLILSAFAWGAGSIVSRQLYLSQLNTEIARLRVEVAHIQQTRDKCREIEDEVDYLVGLYGEGVSLLEILEELSVRIPKAAWIKNFTFSDRAVKIDGRADSSAELIPSIESSPLFEDVAFLSSIMSGKGKEAFRIGFKVK
ncbi:MAG: pilus assembly protein PilM, partial [Deltaproteobacteria bacterium]|nr:pilus assembly protein PilM [Deltaproteobacteria bacterium]